jgi:broad specificity phosphatase PhoE
MVNPRAVQDAFLSFDDDATLLTIVRHGQQDVPYWGKFDPADWSDPPLSALGLQQADALGRAFADIQFDCLVSSAMIRAQQTADAIAKYHGISEVPRIDKLNEVGAHRAHSTSSDVSTREDPAAWAARLERFIANPRWHDIPGGETGPELRERIVPVFEELLNQHEGGHVVVVCHGGVMNAYLAHILDWDGDMLFLPAHTSYSTVRAKGSKRVIQSINERCHLNAEGLVSF